MLIVSLILCRACVAGWLLYRAMTARVNIIVSWVGLKRAAIMHCQAWLVSICKPLLSRFLGWSVLGIIWIALCPLLIFRIITRSLLIIRLVLVWHEGMAAKGE